LYLMKIDHKLNVMMMNNEDECDQTTFVWLNDLTKPSIVGKTSETFEASNNVVVICYRLIAHSEKCIMYALEMHVFKRLANKVIGLRNLT